MILFALISSFFFFLSSQWLQEHYPDDWEHWTKTHIVSYYGIGAPLIGAVDALLATVNGDTMGLPISHLQVRLHMHALLLISQTHIHLRF